MILILDDSDPRLMHPLNCINPKNMQSPPCEVVQVDDGVVAVAAAAAAAVAATTAARGDFTGYWFEFGMVIDLSYDGDFPLLICMVSSRIALIVIETQKTFHVHSGSVWKL